MKNPKSSSKPTKYVSQSEELKTLQATIKDLQVKRLSALRLYQDEKSKAQQQSEKIKDLSQQLSSLKTVKQNSSSSQQTLDMDRHYSVTNGNKNVSNSDVHDTNLINTHSFKADVRAVGLAPYSCYPSLTWHCLAMQDLIQQQTDVFAILHPISSVEHDQQLQPNGSSSLPNTSSLKSNSSSNNSLAGEIKEKQVQKPANNKYTDELLISELKNQLDETTDACKNLAEIVKEQEETIQKLSLKRPV